MPRKHGIRTQRSTNPQPTPPTENKPFLCSRCEPFGRCSGIMPALRQIKRYQLYDYLHMVPLQVVNAGMVRCSKTGRQHLQSAYDAFHQQDYETAILRFHAVLEENATVAEALVGLAIAYFFMEDYQNAARYMLYYEELLPFYTVTNMVDSFHELCITCMATPAIDKPEGKQAIKTCRSSPAHISVSPGFFATLHPSVKSRVIRDAILAGHPPQISSPIICLLTPLPLLLPPIEKVGRWGRLQCNIL